MEIIREMPKLSADMSIEQKGQPAIHYTFTGEVPKEVMDAYEEVVGNGLARVSVSSDMGIKDFGTGASAMVTITLTCGQDAKTIEKAVSLAGELARGYAQENRHRAEAELNTIIEQKKAASANGPRY